MSVSVCAYRSSVCRVSLAELSDRAVAALVATDEAEERSERMVRDRERRMAQREHEHQQQMQQMQQHDKDNASRSSDGCGGGGVRGDSGGGGDPTMVPMRFSLHQASHCHTTTMRSECEVEVDAAAEAQDALIRAKHEKVSVYIAVNKGMCCLNTHAMATIVHC